MLLDRGSRSRKGGESLKGGLLNLRIGNEGLPFCEGKEKETKGFGKTFLEWYH